ncbi:PD-(D/E)XK nuclease family protein [Nocardioides alcanivorans]|uniref:PD-(D/E)XK nuclease family protein n=1 Tax=Nocardioides alcanivorans TaxID=2897352 RepID=UPI00289F2D41|nr:PD-(D/E)XK nuclease family protein [Nocardioides alcanivorans]
MHLRLESRGKVAVQAQAPPTPTDDGSYRVEAQLMDVAKALRTEEFHAVKGPHCDFCAFSAMCPTQQSGTVLS